MTKFWWDQKENDKIIHWLNFNKLCTPKCYGGIRFKDFKIFNQAFLTK